MLPAPRPPPPIIAHNRLPYLLEVAPFGLMQEETAGAGSRKGPTPVVGVIMGSDSDLPTMRAAADVLEEFGVPYELTIVSAHRTPARMTAYAAVRPPLCCVCVSAC